MEDHQSLACFVHDKETINRIKETIKNAGFKVKIYNYKSLDYLVDNIDEDQIDYVFVDKDVQGEDFREILKKLKDHFPHIVRILLAETWSQQLVLMSNEIVHLILEKKYLEENLKDLFIKAERLRALIRNKNLIKIVNSFDQLPVLQPVYMQLLHEIQKPETSLKQIGELVSSDVSLSTKVLQVANMAVFSHIGRISSSKQAVIFLGINVLRALILYIQVFSFDSGKSHLFKYLRQLEKHCLKVAETSKEIAKEFKVDRMMQDDCFTAGLLHDIGKLVIINKFENWEEIQKFAKDKDIPVWEAEEAILGTSHAEIGAYLLGVWGFPPEIVDAVAYHHKPRASKKSFYLPLTFVHIAEAMTQQESVIDEETFHEYLDSIYLDNLGITEKTHHFYKVYNDLIEDEETPDTE